MNQRRWPTYFISHGGGPWPWLKAEMPFFDELEKSLQAIPRELGEKPRAILMISGHWESHDFAIMANPQPPMIYDYGGFPEHTYHIHYRASGDAQLAQDVSRLLGAAGLHSHLDRERGFDHGAFTPLAVMYPDADVPVVQLSLRQDFDVVAHIQVGRVLSELRDQGILIIGSGLSYHNLRQFGNIAVSGPVSRDFDAWLGRAMLSSDYVERTRSLIAWAQAPAARLAHPREDHLMPLLVAVGAAEHEPATRVYYETDFLGGMTVSSYRFGAALSIAPDAGATHSSTTGCGCGFAVK